MCALKVSLFGGVNITSETWPNGIKVTRSGQALLAYLLLQGQRSHSREVLADLFWSDSSAERARGCLSTALWRLRGILEPAGVARGAYLSVTPAGEVSFNWRSDLWLDSEQFARQTDAFLARPAPAITAAEVEQVQQVLTLYTGELLEGFYDDWVLVERERMRSRYLNSFTRLLGYYRQQGSLEEALACGDKVLQLDTLREDIHREMIRLYLATGQRTRALRQFNTCRTLLADELGVPPMPETQALWSLICPPENATAVPAEPDLTQASLRHAAVQISRALQSFEDARRELRQAMQVVEQLTNL